MKNLVSPATMFIFGVVTFIVIMIINKQLEFNNFKDPNFWFYRVLTALAAASISISIPGMISLNHDPQGNELTTTNSDGNKVASSMSLLEKEPRISASGAIAVFVLVYLFNPLV
ncbi:hypothetical protein PW52_08270 [Tamlana sedimentorum]|uniref:Uncharacterized protein n=1 Tax=Neotamlana sedimentorum TaxID=1435349 RepID=A0A0D7WDA9_9FLAO|nr:hypothetical protein [Tamlana sedimentorum]KJD35727.1 hypothetical protein PW52_08270 [Tamlana sedimentorum]